MNSHIELPDPPPMPEHIAKKQRPPHSSTQTTASQIANSQRKNVSEGYFEPFYRLFEPLFGYAGTWWYNRSGKKDIRQYPEEHKNLADKLAIKKKFIILKKEKTALKENITTFKNAQKSESYSDLDKKSLEDLSNDFTVRAKVVSKNLKKITQIILTYNWENYERRGVEVVHKKYPFNDMDKDSLERIKN